MPSWTDHFPPSDPVVRQFDDGSVDLDPCASLEIDDDVEIELYYEPESGTWDIEVVAWGVYASIDVPDVDLEEAKAAAVELVRERLLYRLGLLDEPFGVADLQLTAADDGGAP